MSAYTITFYGKNETTYQLVVATVPELKVIVESSANIMVEWVDAQSHERWGDATGGFAATESLACLLKGEELPEFDEMMALGHEDMTI